MFKLDPIQDLLINRKQVYDSLPLYIRSGIPADIISSDIGFSMRVLSNAPAFQVHYENMPRVDELPEFGDKWDIPFAEFSFVHCVKSFKVITVVSKVDTFPGTLDTLMFQTFVRNSEGQDRWEMYVPMRLSLANTDGEHELVRHMPFAVAEGVFHQSYNREVAKILKKMRVKAPAKDMYLADVRGHFSVIMNVLSFFSKKQDVQYRPARTERIGVNKASTLPKDFWQYNVVKLGSKSSPVPYKGGHHASPRQHVRRGHYRTYASGKCIFIESTIVGDLDKGMIVKDYELKEGQCKDTVSV